MADVVIPNWLDEILITRPVNYKSSVDIKCPICEQVRTVKYRAVRNSKGRGRCTSCAARIHMIAYMKDETNRRNVSDQSRQNWANRSYRKKVTESCRRASIEKWQDEDFRNNVIMGMNHGLNIEEHIEKWIIGPVPTNNLDKVTIICPRCGIKRDVMYKSIQNWDSAMCNFCARIKKSDGINKYDRFKLIKESPNVDWQRTVEEFGYIDQILPSDKVWQICSYCDNISLVQANKFQGSNNDSCFACSRKKMLNRISKPQLRLYEILDELGLRHSREPEQRAQISGPHPNKVHDRWFDGLIFIDDGPDILIEVNSYWHESDDKLFYDHFKSLLIHNDSNFVLRVIWEHEFDDIEKLKNKIMYWVDPEYKLIDFKLCDVRVDQIEMVLAREFICTHHYIPDIPRGGIYFGAMLAESLIAVCIVSHPSRQNIGRSCGINGKVAEISRFAIHPHYHKKNFGSWYLGQILRRLRGKFDAVVSFADMTYNHEGIIYKAANFEYVSEVRPDYWYVDGTRIIHKKTIYNRAKAIGKTERQYVVCKGYRKVCGSTKSKWLYRL